VKTHIKFKRFIKGNSLQEKVFGFYYDGLKYWRLNGNLHREDGPASEYSNGTKSWYLNGNYHRVDGPAIEYWDGTKYWYLNGNLHREDGPAIESNGSKEWYLNGKQFLYEKDYWEAMEDYKKRNKNTK